APGLRRCGEAIPGPEGTGTGGASCRPVPRSGTSPDILLWRDRESSPRLRSHLLQKRIDGNSAWEGGPDVPPLQLHGYGLKLGRIWDPAWPWILSFLSITRRTSISTIRLYRTNCPPT